MSKNTPNKKQYDSFLNVKKSIQLPSNLLSLKKHSLQIQTSQVQPKVVSQSMNQAKYLKNIQQVPPSFVQQKDDQKKNKSVLYKRLTSIKKQNKELGNLSFSKMLSRMVVMQEEDQQQPNFYNVQQRIKHPSIVKPIQQKMYQMKEFQSARRPISRSIEVSDFDKPSRKLFKRYYMPNSEAMQTTYLQTINPDDKYIYKNGKRVECKRIHNFYTSNMFRKGYDKFLRKTTQGFHRP